MRRALIPPLLLLALATGCQRAAQPTLAHGKPVNVWVETLKNPDPAKRKEAVKNLGHVGAADPAVIPALIDALKDKDAKVRAEAALALLNIGPPAAVAVPALEETAKDADAQVRNNSQKALDRIRGK